MRAKCSGAKLGMSSKLEVGAVGERVADLEDARVVDADDVAGEGLLDDAALLREELRRVGEARSRARCARGGPSCRARSGPSRRARTRRDRGARGPCSPGS